MKPFQASIDNPRLRQAAVAMNRNDIPLAERLLKAYLHDSPTDVPAIRMLAEVAMRIGRNDDARNLLARALELAPGFMPARYQLAVLLHRRNECAEALAEVERLLAADPRNPGYRNLKAAVLSRMGDDWGIGRAGMQYRDLIPSRLGGRFIASHIRIPVGGPVPDYVHFHRIRFQMIYCKAGWARLVYEDQGEPFLFHAGDCVLQPPKIRHRVLEASDGLEVIEVGCPALHETFADHAMTLPTPHLLPERDFGGQRFVRHVAAEATWQPWRARGFEMRDTGIAAATDGLAGARVVRARAGAAAKFGAHGGEFLFFFVLIGDIVLDVQGHGQHRLTVDDCCVIPAKAAYSLEVSAGAELLEVTLPAELPH